MPVTKRSTIISQLSQCNAGMRASFPPSIAVNRQSSNSRCRPMAGCRPIAAVKCNRVACRITPCSLATRAFGSSRKPMGSWPRTSQTHRASCVSSARAAGAKVISLAGSDIALRRFRYAVTASSPRINHCINRKSFIAWSTWNNDVSYSRTFCRMHQR